MCNGLVVREKTSSKNAKGPSLVFGNVEFYLQGTRKGRENPAEASESYPSSFGTTGSKQHPKVRPWKSLLCLQQQNPIERSSTARFDLINSFESLDHRMRCPGFSDSESPSEGSSEGNQIQKGKEVKKDETLESRTRET
jgi:hypothetical protein